MAIQYRQSYPFWFYKKVLLADRGASLPPQYLLFDLKNGFDYWIRGLLISYPHQIIVAGNDISPDLKLTLIQSERNRDITETEIPIDLLSNPGSKQPITGGQPNGDRDLHNGYIRWDYLISNSDVIKIRISGQTGGNPDFIRLCVMGNNVRKQGQY